MKRRHLLHAASLSGLLPAIGWAQTVPVLQGLAQAVRARRTLRRDR